MSQRWEPVTRKGNKSGFLTGPVVFLLSWALFSPSSSFGASSYGEKPHRYEINATYYDKGHRIEGVETVTFTNTGETALSEIYLFLYPNFYMEKDPKWKPDFYRKAYPIQFNPGSIEIDSVLDQQGRELILSDFFGIKTVKEIHLNEPIPPFTSFSLVIQFVTRIPERFGVFGQSRDWVTLQGGWHPYLPPMINGRWALQTSLPKSQFHVELTLPHSFHVVASTALQIQREEGTQKTVAGDADGLPFFSLSLGKDVVLKKEKTDAITVTYTLPKANLGYERQVLEAAGKAVSFFLSDWEGASPKGTLPPKEIQLTHAYLHQALVTPGENVLYVDSKLFKVLPLLKPFHEVEIARGIFYILWKEIVPWEEHWVLERLASDTADQFTEHYYPKGLHLKSWLRPIAFFPFVDQILYSDKALLRQVYFKEWGADNETLFAFHQVRSDGPSLGTRLKRRLGPKKLSSALIEYKRELYEGKQPKMKETLLRLFPTEMQHFFEASAYAPLDFGINRIEKKTAGKTYQTKLHINKKGAGIEPVEIVVHEKSGSTTSLLWNGEGDRYETSLVTASPISSVEIDPKGETSDLRRGNNRHPRKWKLLLSRYRLDYDLNTQFLGYEIGFLFQPVYDATYQIGTEFFHSDQRDIGHVQYKRTLRNKHILTAGFSYRSPRSLERTSQDTPAGTVHLSYSLRYPYIPIIQDHIEWLTGQYPNMNITFGYDRGFTDGADASMRNLLIDLRRSFVFSNYHEIGTRFLTGASAGELFKQNRFFLGGEDGMRGYTPLRFEGDNISLLSMEYRFPLVYETDINLYGLALTHTLQGAFFSDWGEVANGSAAFNLSQYKSDAGVGIRWFVDSFGIMPVILRFDVAWPINSPVEEEKDPHYYISAGQLF